MIIIVLCLLFGMAIGIRESYSASYDDDSIGTGIVVGILVGVFVSFVVGLGSYTSSSDIARSNLGYLNDGTAVQGHFFLGSGVIDEKQVYSYYKEVGKNQYKLSRINADGQEAYEVVVQQESITKPYVETLGKNSTPRLSWVWALNFGRAYNLERVVFHVPEGSIKSQVVLDAQ